MSTRHEHMTTAEGMHSHTCSCGCTTLPCTRGPRDPMKMLSFMCYCRSYSMWMRRTWMLCWSTYSSDSCMACKRETYVYCLSLDTTAVVPKRRQLWALWLIWRASPGQQAQASLCSRAVGPTLRTSASSVSTECDVSLAAAFLQDVRWSGRVSGCFTPFMVRIEHQKPNARTAGIMVAPD
jgi:hypothetical protein